MYSRIRTAFSALASCSEAEARTLNSLLSSSRIHCRIRSLFDPASGADVLAITFLDVSAPSLHYVVVQVALVEAD
jgi:hypothetical protein